MLSAWMWMESYRVLPVVGMLIAAAITPGPNNFLVLHAGARGGFAAAGKVVLGVLLGSALLLVVTAAGLAQVLGDHPALAAALSIAGALYLGWLGVSLMLHAGDTSSESAARGMPSSVTRVALFQLVNPKAWMLVVTSLAALTDAGGGVLVLSFLIVIVSGTCLALWAWAGAATSRLGRPVWVWIDRAMGALLTLSAAGLVRGVVADGVAT